MKRTCDYCLEHKDVRALASWNNPERINYYCDQHYGMIQEFQEAQQAEFIGYYSDEKNREGASAETVELYNLLNDGK